VPAAKGGGSTVFFATNSVSPVTAGCGRFTSSLAKDRKAGGNDFEMDKSMSKRRFHRTAEPSFPNRKPAIASCSLIVTVMLILVILADPRSGDIRSPALAWFLLAGVPAAMVGLFYGEFRLRNMHTRTGLEQPKQGSRVKRPSTKGLAGSRKC
jgi:hypothetical protein